MRESGAKLEAVHSLSSQLASVTTHTQGWVEHLQVLGKGSALWALPCNLSPSPKQYGHATAWGKHAHKFALRYEFS
jgi:hypothetical protein